MVYIVRSARIGIPAVVKAAQRCRYRGVAMAQDHTRRRTCAEVTYRMI